MGKESEVVGARHPTRNASVRKMAVDAIHFVLSCIFIRSLVKQLCSAVLLGLVNVEDGGHGLKEGEPLGPLKEQ
jgi:hypothetical protein